MGLTGGSKTLRRAVRTKKVWAHKDECTSTGFCHGPYAQEGSEESRSHEARCSRLFCSRKSRRRRGVKVRQLQLVHSPPISATAQLRVNK